MQQPVTFCWYIVVVSVRFSVTAGQVLLLQGYIYNSVFIIVNSGNFIVQCQH